MGSVRFDYGSFEKVLRKYMAPNLSFEEIANALLLSPLTNASMSAQAKQAVYNQHYIDEATVTKIRRGSRKITKELLRDYLNPVATENVEHHFATEILPYVPVIKVSCFINDILSLIGECGEVSPQEKEYFQKAAARKSSATFLAEAYIFAVTGISAVTKNIPIQKTTNIPPQNRFFCGRDGLLASIRKCYQEGVHIQGLFGMGGVGKTQLALQYAHCHMKEYNVVWWINAGSALGMQNSISEFLALQGFLPGDEGTECIGDRFSDYCRSHKKWLFIYDNAEYGTPEEYGTLLKYFPQDTSGGDVLLTTRCRKPFEHAEHREVFVWSCDEAAAFLARRSGIRDDRNAGMLAKQMGCLPLALEYASAYIRETPDVDYAVYSQKLERYGVKVLDRRVGHQMYKLTVREAFHITLDRLLKNLDVDPLARGAAQFLNICAFLAPDGIEIRCFSHNGKGLPEPMRTVVENELDFDELTRLLTKYSLVRVEQGSMSMHRLLQEILRDELTPTEEILCINYAYGVFYSLFYSMREMPMEEIRPALSSSAVHVQTVLYRYVQRSRNGRPEPYDGIMVAKEYFSWTSFLLTDIKKLEPSEQAAAYRRELPVLQTAAEFYEALPGCGNIYQAYTLLLLAQANAELGNTQEAPGQYLKSLCMTNEIVEKFPADIRRCQSGAIQELYRTEAFLLASDICAAVGSSPLIYNHTELMWQNLHSLIKILLKQLVCFPRREEAQNYRETLLNLWIFSQQVADCTRKPFVLRLKAPETWLGEQGYGFLDGFYGFFCPKEELNVDMSTDVLDGFDILLKDSDHMIPEPVNDSWVTLAFGNNVQSLDDMLDVLLDMEGIVQNRLTKRSLCSAVYVMATNLNQENIKAFYEKELKMWMD